MCVQGPRAGRAGERAGGGGLRAGCAGAGRRAAARVHSRVRGAPSWRDEHSRHIGSAGISSSPAGLPLRVAHTAHKSPAPKSRGRASGPCCHMRDMLHVPAVFLTVPSRSARRMGPQLPNPRRRRPGRQRRARRPRTRTSWPTRAPRPARRCASSSASPRQAHGSMQLLHAFRNAPMWTVNQSDPGCLPSHASVSWSEHGCQMQPA